MLSYWGAACPEQNLASVSKMQEDTLDGSEVTGAHTPLTDTKRKFIFSNQPTAFYLQS